MTQQSPLVTPDWLEEQLLAADVLALDCRVQRVPQPVGPSIYETRKADWQAARIPGAAYVHFNDDLADLTNPTPFTLAEPAQIEAVLGRLGVTEKTTLVTYGDAADLGAHRVWWALTVTGYPNVRVLDGGLNRWKAEGRPIESGPSSFKPCKYNLPSRRGTIARRRDVLAAIVDPQVCLMNALSVEHFRGEGDQIFGRRGRIPGSISLPAAEMIDHETGCFRSAKDLRNLFDATLPATANRLIPYCGGGVAACTLALALTIVGRTDIAVYDGSLLEWSKDPDAPMEVG